jgi:hypothetical protein
MKKLQILLLALLPTLFYSQNDYRDTVIEALINKKINEYRVENGIYELILTERFRKSVDAYAIVAADKLEKYRLLEHSHCGLSENICFIPADSSWKYYHTSKEEAYKSLFSQEHLAQTAIDCWKKSPGHNAMLLQDTFTKQLITSVYVYYNDHNKRWSMFVVSNFPTDHETGQLVLDFTKK